MPFTFDMETYAIKMSAGDTANIAVNISWNKLSEGDVLLFAVFDPYTGTDVLCKNSPIEGGRANIRLCNHDTRDIPPGRYRWNLRAVTSPAKDKDGNIKADECSDDVVTVFDNPPSFKIGFGGAYV